MRVLPNEARILRRLSFQASRDASLLDALTAPSIGVWIGQFHDINQLIRTDRALRMTIAFATDRCDGSIPGKLFVLWILRNWARRRVTSNM